MSIVKLNNQGVKNATAFGSITGLGSMIFIKKLTASGSATLSFVDGASGVVLDDTYKEYVFTFNNIHSSSENSFGVNFRDGGSSYDAVKTSSGHRAYHFENDGGAGLGYEAFLDLAQSTSLQQIGQPQSSGDNDSSGCGYLHLFNPASTVMVKHYISHYVHHYTNSAPGEIDNFMAGYCNTVTAIDGVQFKFDSGNIDAGDICLYGIA
jgi:hypothetical protein